MAPGYAGRGAGLGDAAGKHGVAEKALGLVQFAGVDVGLAGVAGGVDEERGLFAAEQVGEHRGLGVVKVRPAQIAEGNALAREQGLIGGANETSASEEIDHGRCNVSGRDEREGTDAAPYLRW